MNDHLVTYMDAGTYRNTYRSQSVYHHSDTTFWLGNVGLNGAE